MPDAFTTPVRLVVLDCDGVLFESRAANIAFYNAIFERMGLEAMDAELEHHCHFSSSRQLLGRRFDEDAEQIERAVTIARALDYGPFFRHMIPVEGLIETLAVLGRNRSVGMATNRTRTGHDVIDVFDLGAHIHFVSTVTPEVPPKPAPDMLLRCLEHFEVAAHEAVYVGDADSDRVAAEAAGMLFVGVGDQPRTERRVANFKDVPSLIPPLDP